MTRLSLLAGMGLWWTLVWFAPWSVFWRDSGEFFLGALYLDIAHPAGFPLFSQLANLAALIPLGPVAWRISLFAAFIAVLFVVLIGIATQRVVINTFQPGRWQGYAYGCIAMLLPLAAPTFLKQSLSIEVYMLNAVILTALLFLYAQFLQRNDLRWLIAGCFLAGLGCGNHVSLVIPAGTMLIIVLLKAPLTRKALPQLLCAGLCGLGVYGYLPARAGALPPLNTGNPVTAERFVSQITNARDRALRTGSEVPAEAVSDHWSLLDNAAHDLWKLRQEFPTVLLVGGLCGAILLTVASPSIGIALWIVVIGNYLFFFSWDPDPWMPLFGLCAIGVAYALAAASRRMGKIVGSRHPGSCIPVLGVCASMALCLTSQNLSLLRYLKHYDLPARYAQQLLEMNGRSSVLLLEHSWFLAKYLRDVESFREELPLIYQPSLLFPHYFAPTSLYTTAGTFSSNEGLSREAPVKNVPQFRSLAQAIAFVTRTGNFGLEPANILNHELHRILRLTERGNVEIVRNLPQEIQTSFTERTIALLSALREDAVSAPRIVRGDTVNFLDNILNSYVDLLRAVARPGDAVKLLRSICSGPAGMPCTAATMNHLAFVLMELKQYSAAVELLDELSQIPSPETQRLRFNLELARKLLQSSLHDKPTGHTTSAAPQPGGT